MAYNTIDVVQSGIDSILSWIWLVCNGERPTFFLLLCWFPMGSRIVIARPQIGILVCGFPLPRWSRAGLAHLGSPFLHALVHC